MDETPQPATISSVKVASSFQLPGIGFCVAAGAKPADVYFGCSDFTVYRMDTSSEKVEAAAVSETHHESYVTGLVRSGNHLISGSYDTSLIWWNAESGQLIRRVEQAHARWIRKLAINPAGTVVASVADDMKTCQWDVETGKKISEWAGYSETTPHGYPSMLYTVTYSADGKWLATGDRTGRVLVRDTATGDTAATLETPIMYTWDPKARRHSIGGVRSLAFSHDSLRLAVGGIGTIGNIDHLGGPARIEVFNWQDNERVLEISDETHKGLVEQLQFAADDSYVIAAGGDNSGFVSLFSAKDGKVLAQDKAPMHVHDFALDPETSTIRCVGFEKGAVIQLG